MLIHTLFWWQSRGLASVLRPPHAGSVAEQLSFDFTAHIRLKRAATLSPVSHICSASYAYLSAATLQVDHLLRARHIILFIGQDQRGAAPTEKNQSEQSFTARRKDRCR